MTEARERFMEMIDREGYGAWINSDYLATTLIEQRAVVEAMFAEGAESGSSTHPPTKEMP